MGERLIINLPTKAHWRLPSKYEYIDSGLQALRDYLMIHPVKSLAMPALGCSNGGLDWKMVKPKIEDNLAELNISIWVYEPA
ncbi:MAG: macro domain-containing protein [Bacteroidota bacterium]